MLITFDFILNICIFFKKIICSKRQELTRLKKNQLQINRYVINIRKNATKAAWYTLCSKYCILLVLIDCCCCVFCSFAVVVLWSVCVFCVVQQQPRKAALACLTWFGLGTLLLRIKSYSRYYFFNWVFYYFLFLWFWCGASDSVLHFVALFRLLRFCLSFTLSRNKTALQIRKMICCTYVCFARKLMEFIWVHLMRCLLLWMEHR